MKITSLGIWDTTRNKINQSTWSEALLVSHKLAVAESYLQNQRLILVTQALNLPSIILAVFSWAV